MIPRAVTPDVDELVNALEQLLHAVMGDWTARQHASVMHYLDTPSEAAAAEALGVSQPTLHKSVASAHGKDVLAVMEARNRYLARGFGDSVAVTPPG